MTMQEVAKQNIKEEFERVTKRVEHRTEQFHNNEIDSDFLYDIVDDYYNELKGFIKAYWTMGILTDEEYHNLKCRALDVIEIMYK